MVKKARISSLVEKHILPERNSDSYDEAFLTGTAAEITPIKSIDNINFSTGDKYFIL